MRRLTEVLQGLNNKTEAERRALDRLTDDFNQLKADREAQVSVCVCVCLYQCLHRHVLSNIHVLSMYQ